MIQAMYNTLSKLMFLMLSELSTLLNITRAFTQITWLQCNVGVVDCMSTLVSSFLKYF